MSGFKPLKSFFLKINFLLGTLGFLALLLQSYGKILFRYGCNYAEPIIAWSAFQVRYNPIIYKHFDEGSMTVFAYNPLYAYAVYTISLLTGPTFMAGRLTSFLFFILLIVVTFHILKLCTKDKALALAACAWIALVPLITAYACDFRADMMGLALNALAIFFFLRWEKKSIDQTTRDTFLGLLFSTLAFFTRQNYFFAVGAFILLLLTKRHFKQAFFLIQTQFALFIIPMMLLNYFTHGAYYENVITFNMNAFYWNLVWDSWLHYVPYLLGLLAIGGVFFILRAFKKETDFFDLYLLAALVSSLMSGKIGSDSNYFIEVAYALGLYLAVLLASYGDFKKNTGLSLALWVLFTGHFAFFVWQKTPEWHLDKILQTEQTKKLDEVSAFIQKIPGKIISEDMGLLIASGKPIYYEPFEYSQLARRGLWDEKKILDQIDAHEYSAIILTTNIFTLKQTSRFTPAMITHLRKSYKAKGVFNGYLFLIPNEA